MGPWDVHSYQLAWENSGFSLWKKGECVSSLELSLACVGISLTQISQVSG